MSKSLKRVEAALTAAGITPDLRAPGETRTAEMAAAAVGCAVDQIAKSIIFQGQTSGHVVLFITAGSNREGKPACARGPRQGRCRPDPERDRLCDRWRCPDRAYRAGAQLS